MNESIYFSTFLIWVRLVVTPSLIVVTPFVIVVTPFVIAVSTFPP